MQLVSQFKTVEKSVEKEILAFFSLIGASETPEEWEFCKWSLVVSPPLDSNEQTAPLSHH